MKNENTNFHILGYDETGAAVTVAHNKKSGSISDTLATIKTFTEAGKAVKDALSAEIFADIVKRDKERLGINQ